MAIVELAINIALNGAVQPISTPSMVNGQIVADIYTPRFSIQSDPSNANALFIQSSDLSGTPPADITNTSANYVLTPGQIVVIQVDDLQSQNGEKFALSRWYVKGTNGQKAHVSYQKRI